MPTPARPGPPVSPKPSRRSPRAIDDAFAKGELRFKSGFCAPYWLWNDSVVRALDEKGWSGDADRNQPSMLKTKRTYTNSHSIDEPFRKSTGPVLTFPGQMDQPSANDLDRCLLNLMKLPANTDRQFASEMVAVQP